MSDEDRAVAAERRRLVRGDDSRTARRTAAAGRARSRCISSVLQRRREPDLWFIQHYLWGLRRARARSFARGLGRGLRPVNEAFADGVLAELDREPDAAVFFHDYHLYLAPALVRERARTRRSRTSSTSRGPSRLLARRCRDGPDGARSTRGCSRTTWSASTPTAGGAKFLAVACER